MSNVKYVIVESSGFGRKYRAVPGLAFETQEAAEKYLVINARRFRRAHVEMRELKADDTNLRMTCQCCGRKILSKGGVIAHHGYQRPHKGWQTSSCFGARALPFEVSRAALGGLINMQWGRLQTMQMQRERVYAGTDPVTLSFTVYGKNGRRKTRIVTFFPDTFETVMAQAVKDGYRGSCYGEMFPVFKRLDLADRDRKIRMQVEWIAEMQVRYEGWKQTHKRDGDLWVTI